MTRCQLTFTVTWRQHQGSGRKERRSTEVIVKASTLAEAHEAVHQLCNEFIGEAARVPGKDHPEFSIPAAPHHIEPLPE